MISDVAVKLNKETRESIEKIQMDQKTLQAKVDNEQDAKLANLERQIYELNSHAGETFGRFQDGQQKS